MGTYTCGWCGTSGEGIQRACLACGATVDVRAVVSDSGWTEMPPRKDMARLQFGKSHCQIEGRYVPVADMNLAPEDGVYFSHHVLLWMDPTINITTMPMAGAWKRMFAGLPLIMTQAQGPGHIAFSQDNPGEMIALPLQQGQAVDVREHHFVVATHSIKYEWYQSDVWYMTQVKDVETHYPLGMFIDRFHAPAGPGLLLLHAGGNVFVRHLAAGQAILVKPSALIFKDPSVSLELHFEYPANPPVLWFGTLAYRHLWLRVRGPGRVAVQSAFEHPEESLAAVIRTSQATTHRW